MSHAPRRSTRARFAGALAAAPLAGQAMPAPAASTYTLRMGLPGQMNSTFGLAAVRFAQAIERRSAGRIKVEMYPSYTLAKPQETIDGLVSGTVDLAMQASAYLVPLVPQLQVFDMPFLFRDAASGYRVLDGPIGQELFSELEKKGVAGLGFGASGFKEFTANKAVNVPEDMKGVRVRIQSGAVYVAMYQAIGAIPVVIDASEAFFALQSRTVDAVDLNLDLITTEKYYTVVKHVALLHQVLSVIVLMGSKRKLDVLPADLQRIVRDEGRAALPYWRSLVAQQTTADIDILKKNGVTFTEVSQSLFRKTVEPVYAAFGPKIGDDLLDRVRRAAGSR